ncbi:MAG: hypothetical protein ABIL47_07015 [candidate division WOR-3 bacterium]
MNSITRNYLKYLLGKYLKENLDNLNNIYFFIAKSTPWNSTDTPDLALGSTNEFIKTWDEILYMEKLSPFNFFPVIKHFKWTQNTVYSQYEHDINLQYIYKNNHTNPLYCINKDFRVYKCIWNNYNSPSLRQPGVDVQINNIVGNPESVSFLRYDDGYVWKYMYTISASTAYRFLTRTYIPVEYNDNVATNAIDGTVDFVKIIDQGDDYVNGVYTNIKIRKNNNTTNIEDDAEVTIEVQNNKIHSVYVTNPGTGYRYARLDDSIFPTAMKGSSGSGAILKPIISPVGGHGSNVYDEMFVDSFMTYTILDNEEDVPPAEDIEYRKFGLIFNPKLENNNLLTSLRVYRNTSNILVTNDPTPLEVKKYSGIILYQEHVPPIERNVNQREVFRLVLNL